MIGKALSKDIIYYGLIKGVGVIYWIVLIKISTTYLSPEKFGNFSIVFNLSLYLMILMTTWMSASLIRFYHEYDQKNKIYAIIIRQYTRTAIIISAFLILLYIALNGVMSKEYGYIAAYVIPLGLVNGVYMLCVSLVRVKRNLPHYLRIVLLQAIVSLVLIAALIDGFGWHALVMGMLISFVVVSGTCTWKKRDRIRKEIAGTNDRGLKSEMFQYGFPIMMVGLFGQLLSSADIIVLKYYGYDEAVGVYSANYNVSEKSVFMILSVLVSAFVPYLFQKIGEGQVDVIKEINKVAILFGLISLPILLILYSYSLEISSLLVGEEYVSGYYIIPYIALAGVFMGVGSLYSEIFTVLKQTNVLAWIFGFTAVFNISANIVFVRDGGMLAAVITTVISYFLLMIVVAISSYWKKTKLVTTSRAGS